MKSVSHLVLSKAAQALWGKTDLREDQAWLPLYIHMYDSYRVAERLWEVWVPRSTKSIIARGLGNRSSLAKRLFLFLAGIHDLGKATPAFQLTPIWTDEGRTCFIARDERAGLPFPAHVHASKAPKHTVAGQVLLEGVLKLKFGIEPMTSRSLTSIVGGHHGTPSVDEKLLEAREGKPQDLGLNSEPWNKVQLELFEYVQSLADLEDGQLSALFGSYVPPSATSLLLGLVIMTDWIASNQDLFSLVSAEPGSKLPNYSNGQIINTATLSQRFEAAWSCLDLLPCWQEDSCGVASWDDLYSKRFVFPAGASPRPVQAAALRIAVTANDPGLMILEAPMGEGKTEAALAAAEVLGSRVGCGGVCIALPTMATTDAMFGRVHAWIERLPQPAGQRTGSIFLAHGKAQLNEEFTGIARAGDYQFMGQDLGEDAREEKAVVSDWMYGRKRGMLANFVVCTIDQVLMGALQMKHLALRQLALANKVVIIDECHAYDTYVQQYLFDVLEWLGSWRTPVILLSATLPEGLRNNLAQAYLKGRASTCEETAVAQEGKPQSSQSIRSLLSSRKRNRASRVQIDDAPADGYPLVSYSEGLSLRHEAIAPGEKKSVVELKLMGDDVDSVVELLKERLSGGGCAGVICDTVGRAQETYAALTDCFGKSSVSLVHARFTDLDRMENEKTIREMLGPRATVENGKRPGLHIVVGTQVLEQSLDLDFDVLVSDAAPIDLLFQRLGRVHRHTRPNRPTKLRQAAAFIRGIESWDGGQPHFARGVKAVYKEASLLEALCACRLCEEGASATVTLPQDIARLVRLAYREDARTALGIPCAWQDTYDQACSLREEWIENKKSRAATCLLQSEAFMCKNRHTLTGWYSPQRMVVESGSVRDADYGPRAVRDTQETVEVMALCLQEGRVHLLPWIGNRARGVEPGAELPIYTVPQSSVAKVAAQSTVRLPLALCSLQHIDNLIDELEQMDAPYVGTWQESPWLEGQLALLFQANESGDYIANLMGYQLSYSREVGLSFDKADNGFRTLKLPLYEPSVPDLMQSG